MGNALSLKDEQKRESILNGNVLKVLLKISFPVFLFSLFNSLYTFFDAYIISSISKDGVSAVMFFDQIKNTISSIGGGLAIGGCVIVSRYLGGNQIEKARKTASCTFYFMVIISLLVIFIFVPFAKPILYLAQTPENLIETGLNYFNIQVITIAVSTMNVVYIGLERAKGNTKFILFLNIGAMIIKIALTSFFVLVLKKNLTWVAIGTLLAQFSILLVAIKVMTNKKNYIRLLKPNKDLFSFGLIKNIVILSLPIVIGKFMFSIGKVIVNSFSVKYYGSDVVGALGISGTIITFVQLLAGSYEETLPSLTSQNIGNNNIKRAFSFTKSALTSSLIYIVILFVLQHFTMDIFIKIFSDNTDEQYSNLIKNIYFWNRFDAISMWISGILSACLIGFGATKIVTYSNIFRLFVIRIPMIIILHDVFKMGEVAPAMAMSISNILTTVVVIFYYIWYKRKPVVIQ